MRASLIAPVLAATGTLFCCGCSLETHLHGSVDGGPRPGLDSAAPDSHRSDSEGFDMLVGMPDVGPIPPRDAGRTDSTALDGGAADVPPTCVPTEEICNARDDNCNEEIDEEGACGAECATIRGGGSLYLLCEIAITWAGAREYCADVGYGDLVTIESPEEQERVRSAAFSARMADWWIGLEDPTEGTYQWVNGEVIWTDGSAVKGKYNNWRGRAPDGSNVEDCAELDTSGGWADGACRSLQPFVCETPDE